jgi:AraC family transcriptional regulator, exoenzyme S synthesis regulatory protein ExsA
MPIQNIPEDFIHLKKNDTGLYVYDFKMTEDAVNSQVNLTHHMFSFLQYGEKKVRLEEHVVEVNKKQSVLLKAGNCLITELLDNNAIYFCKLLFFTNLQVSDFFEKHAYLTAKSRHKKDAPPFFLIKNDHFTDAFVSSISSVMQLNRTAALPLIAVKFEEIMLYLSHRYGPPFISFMLALAQPEKNASFRKIVEANINAGISLADIAFLANMSLSTFKRRFEAEYKSKPGKWLQQKRLQRAKMILEKGMQTPAEIYTAFGYASFSNFSAAFKNEFGFSPKQCRVKAN